jgi:hypothetical protein
MLLTRDSSDGPVTGSVRANRMQLHATKASITTDTIGDLAPFTVAGTMELPPVGRQPVWVIAENAYGLYREESTLDASGSSNSTTSRAPTLLSSVCERGGAHDGVTQTGAPHNTRSSPYRPKHQENRVQIAWPQSALSLPFRPEHGDFGKGTESVPVRAASFREPHISSTGARAKEEEFFEVRSFGTRRAGLRPEPVE